MGGGGGERGFSCRLLPLSFFARFSICLQVCVCFVQDGLVAVYLERVVLLEIRLCCVVLDAAVLGVYAPFPFGVLGRMRTFVVSVPSHCHFIYCQISKT